MSRKQQPSPPDFIVQLVHIEGPLKGQIQKFEQTPVTKTRKDPKRVYQVIRNSIGISILGHG